MQCTRFDAVQPFFFNVMATPTAAADPLPPLPPAGENRHGNGRRGFTNAALPQRHSGRSGAHSARRRRAVLAPALAPENGRLGHGGGALLLRLRVMRTCCRPTAASLMRRFSSPCPSPDSQAQPGIKAFVRCTRRVWPAALTSIVLVDNPFRELASLPVGRGAPDCFVLTALALGTDAVAQLAALNGARGGAYGLDCTRRRSHRLFVVQPSSCGPRPCHLPYGPSCPCCRSRCSCVCVCVHAQKPTGCAVPPGSHAPPCCPAGPSSTPWTRFGPARVPRRHPPSALSATLSLLTGGATLLPAARTCESRR